MTAQDHVSPRASTEAAARNESSPTGRAGWLSHRSATVMTMAERKIWTAAELENMSPNERRDIVRSGFETDLSRVQPELLERARRKVEERIAATEGSATVEG